MASETKGADYKTGFVLFSSSVAGSVLIDKDTDRVKFLLSAHKVPFTYIDLSLAINAEAKTYMAANSSNAKPTTLPQVFKDGKYVGTKDELDEANEDGALKKLLGA